MACIVSLNRLYRIQDTGYRIQQRNNSSSNSNSDTATTATAAAIQLCSSNSGSHTPQLYSYGHTACGKSQKNRDADLDLAPPPYRSASVSLSGVIARATTQPKHYGYLIFFIIFVSKQIIMRKIFNVSPSLMGYDMKDGRMVRTAPCPDMGLTKLANLKKEMKRAKKIDMIAEGVRLGKL